MSADALRVSRDTRIIRIDINVFFWDPEALRRWILPPTVSLLFYFLSPPCGISTRFWKKTINLCMRLNIGRGVYMMNITAQYKRDDFVSFLSAGFLPDDFKTAQEIIT